MTAGSRRGVILSMVFSLALVIAAVMLGASGARAIIAPPTEEDHDEELHETLDTRRADANLRIKPTQLAAAEELISSAGEGVRISYDERFGTPRKIDAQEGFLSDPSSGNAVEVAKDWISANRNIFDLTQSEVAALVVSRDHELPESGTHVVSLDQVFGGVTSATGGRMNVAVTEDGRVLSYTGNANRGNGLLGNFELEPREAVENTVAELAPGITDYVPELVDYDPEVDDPEEWQLLNKGPFPVAPRIKQVAFPTANGAIPAFRVLLIQSLEGQAEAHDVVINATNGEVLYKTSLVEHQVLPDSEGLVYDNYPEAPSGGDQVTRSFEGDPEASPSGWTNPSGVGNINGPTTFGNNADTFANWSNFLAPADQPNRPVNPLGQFNYPYAGNWPNSECTTAPGNTSYIQDRDPAVTNLFYHHNRIHDDYYNLGFTESAGNFQVNNGTKGGLPGDPVQGLAQAGAASGGAPGYTGRNNAYMLTLPDGQPSWSGMFLWEPIPAAFVSPCVDGDFDASVIQHEYTHGLTNRYVGGGDALGAFQSGSMGEGWSDWYALDYLFENGYEDEPVTGIYVTGNEERGIRNWDFDENPTTFGDIGYDIVGPEVHSDGEIWTAVLWDLRKNLVKKYGEDRGALITRQLVTDAQPLTAPDPSFLDARDGILQADKNRFQRANFDLIWSTFAKRGMGTSAKTEGAEDTDPTPAFDHPTDRFNGRLSGKVINIATGKPVKGARVIFGRYEARTTQIASTSAAGGFNVEAVAGTYPVTVQAPGYGSRTYNQPTGGMQVRAGRTNNVTIKISPNLASKNSGAKIARVSSQNAANPARNLLDDTEASVWETRTQENGFTRQSVVIELSSTRQINSFRPSAFKSIAGARFAAMEGYTIETSLDGKTWKMSKKGRFSADDPRPVTPELTYQPLIQLANPVRAKFVRFTITSAQDNSVGYAMAAELQVRAGAKENVTPTETAPVRPFDDAGTISVGNAATGDPTGLGAPFLGVTGTDFQQNCGTVPPATQGEDGHVTQLPNVFADGTKVISVTGDSGAAGHDLDLYFLDANCEVIGSAATPSANESGAIPGGTRYVVTVLYSGADVPFKLRASASS